MLNPLFSIRNIATVLGISTLTLAIILSCGKKKKDPAAVSIANDTVGLSEEAAGKLVFGANRSVTLTLSNGGDLDATIGTLIFKDSAGTELPAYDYTGGDFPGTGGTCTTTLASASSCTISVTFTDPDLASFAKATYDATAVLSYTDSEGAYELKFSAGILLPAFIKVRHETKELTTYSFGGRAFGGTRSVKLSVENEGELSATLSSLSFVDSQQVAVTSYGYTGGTFPGTGASCTTTLAPEKKCSVSLTFTAPTSTAYADTTVSATAGLVFNNGVKSKTASFGVTGTATQCSNGSGLTIEQLAYDSGSALSITGDNTYVAQSFSFPERRFIKKVKLSQYKGASSSITGVRLSFFVAPGGAPATTAAATYDFSDPGIVQGSRGYFTYTLSTPMEIPASTNYFLAISYVGVTGTFYTDRETVDSESTGSYYYYNGTTWGNTAASDITLGMETCITDSLADPSATYAD